MHPFASETTSLLAQVPNNKGRGNEADQSESQKICQRICQRNESQRLNQRNENEWNQSERTRIHGSGIDETGIDRINRINRIDQRRSQEIAQGIIQNQETGSQSIGIRRSQGSGNGTQGNGRDRNERSVIRNENEAGNGTERILNGRTGNGSYGSGDETGTATGTEIETGIGNGNGYERNEILPSLRSHNLSAPVVSMLAIGGTIGTGLFFSISKLIVSGPLMALAAMCYVAFLVVIVLEVTTELAVFLPSNGSICKFQFLFLSYPMGLANSIIYWLSWGLTYALELSLLVPICSVWSLKVSEHQTSLILACGTLLTVLNLLPVNLYGRIEFWMALVKVLAILAWIVTVTVTLVSEEKFFYVWVQDWPASFLGDPLPTSQMLVEFLNCLIFSSFVFQSVESIAITTGDVLSPEKTIPKVTRVLFVRIVVFYLVSVFLLSVSVPYNDPRLVSSDLSNLLSSPFLIALLNLGFSSSGTLLSAFNFVILSAIFSAANSNIYFGSRYLESMVASHAGTRWQFLARRNDQNVPQTAVLFTASFGLVALFLRFNSVQAVFNLLLTCCASAGMLMWCLLCVSHIRFRKALRVQKIPLGRLKYCSEWRLGFWSYFASVNLMAILCLNGFTNYWNFTWSALLGSYMTPATFFLLWAYFQYSEKEGFVDLNEIDLGSGNLRPQEVEEWIQESD